MVAESSCTSVEEMNIVAPAASNRNTPENSMAFEGLSSNTLMMVFLAGSSFAQELTEESVYVEGGLCDFSERAPLATKMSLLFLKAFSKNHHIISPNQNLVN
jgi:hypothetical protein